MSYEWEEMSNRVGVDDLTLLSSISESKIVENLKKRLGSGIIYTYISFTLIAVNPYKMISGLYGPDQIKRYRGKYNHELPPHIYALADKMYRDLLGKKESQAVIITGESGAGKTESAKLIMQYIAAVSGGGSGKIEHVKKVILESNQVLESFGNACTVQNNNSSRFGKYLEIQFSDYGAPVGGRVRSYLLEKSRVVYQQHGERNFHIFYQLTMGAPEDEKRYYGITGPEDFVYTSQGDHYNVENVNEVEEYKKTRQAMEDIGIDQDTADAFIRTVAIVLHLGNIFFEEDDEGKTIIPDEDQLAFTASLMGVEPADLAQALLYRQISTGSRRGSVYNVALNVDQAYVSRDALAKAIYSRMFDVLVRYVNSALGETQEELVIGILDIFGFEIFENNGFEQFNINYVNEKLQQIFIELTLKLEQEEYESEGIEWTPVKYFNNKVVCDLIESKRNPTGILTILDDVCLMPVSKIQTQDDKFLQKLDETIGTSEYYRRSYQMPTHFEIKHYAGTVTYNSVGFCDKNMDTLFNDLILVCQKSDFEFLNSLFPEKIDKNSKKRPTSTGTKVRANAAELVNNLMKCVPSYIRCIRPNAKKKPLYCEEELTKHQVKYLGLLENVRVKRAGFAFRQEFERFLHHFGVLAEKTWPHWEGDPKEGCRYLLNYINMDPEEWQLGKTKVFIRHPESLFHVEEMKARKYYDSARRIQRAFRMWKSKKHFLELRRAASDIMVGNKQRRRLSLNRVFVGDYINYNANPRIKNVMEENGHGTETLIYANRVSRVRYSKFLKKATREDRHLLMTDSGIYLIAQTVVKIHKRKVKKLVISRKFKSSDIAEIELSTLADNFMNLKLPGYDLFIEDDKKTEFITLVQEQRKELGLDPVRISFKDVIYVKEKRGNIREVKFEESYESNPVLPTLKGGRKTLTVFVRPGLPKDSRPMHLDEEDQVAPSSTRRSKKFTREVRAKREPPAIRTQHKENRFAGKDPFGSKRLSLRVGTRLTQSGWGTPPPGVVAPQRRPPERPKGWGDVPKIEPASGRSNRGVVSQRSVPPKRPAPSDSLPKKFVPGNPPPKKPVGWGARRAAAGNSPPNKPVPRGSPPDKPVPRNSPSKKPAGWGAGRSVSMNKPLPSRGPPKKKPPVRATGNPGLAGGNAPSKKPAGWGSGRSMSMNKQLKKPINKPLPSRGPPKKKPPVRGAPKPSASAGKQQGLGGNRVSPAKKVPGWAPPSKSPPKKAAPKRVGGVVSPERKEALPPTVAEKAKRAASGPKKPTSPPVKVPPRRRKLPKPPVVKRPTAKVLFDFEPVERPEIPLRKGETVYIIKKSEDGWWELEKLDGTKGIGPFNYLEVQE